MALDDNDMIDRALDAAEAKLEGAEAPAEATPTAESHEGSEVETPTEAAPSPERPRDETGKFTKGTKAEKRAKAAPVTASAAPTEAPSEEPQVSDQNANAENVEAGPQGTDPQEPPIEPPAFWSAAGKAAFAKASPDLKKAIVEHEGQRNDWANRLASEVAQSKALVKTLSDSFEPHRARLQSNGVRDLPDAVTRLLAWNEQFETNLVPTVLEILRRNGLTPADLIEDQGASQFQTDPRVDQALERAEAAEKQAKEIRAMYDEQARQAGAVQLESFRQGKDSAGQPRAQYFDMYRPQIAHAFQEIRTLRPEISETDALNHAYEFVVGEARKIFGFSGSRPTVAPTQTPAKPAAPAAKAKAAASSVTGAPSSGASPQRPRLKGNTFGEKLDSAIDAAFDRAGVQ